MEGMDEDRMRIGGGLEEYISHIILFVYSCIRVLEGCQQFPVQQIIQYVYNPTRSYIREKR